MTCKICNSDNLELVLSLPDYPLNTIYLEEQSFDKQFQKGINLYCCQSCNHFQAISDVSINDLYNDDYLYHPESPAVGSRVQFIANQISKFKDIKFNRVIDIGCFDTSLLKKASEVITANHFIGVDPSIPNVLISNPGNLILFKDYIENINLPHYDENLPDLVLSDQTFEHIPNVNESLAHLASQVSINSYFVISVPSTEELIEKLNFQTILHEHLNYFTINTLTHLFENHQLTLESSMIDYRPTANNLLCIYCKKPTFTKNNLKPNIYTKQYFYSYYKVFKMLLNETNKIIAQIASREKIYGFGASDITPQLAYFMETDFSYLACILDDTPHKKDKFIPNIKPQIISPESIKADLVDSNCLMVSPKASRNLYNRMNQLGFKKVINPIGIIS